MPRKVLVVVPVLFYNMLIHYLANVYVAGQTVSGLFLYYPTVTLGYTTRLTCSYSNFPHNFLSVPSNNNVVGRGTQISLS